MCIILLVHYQNQNIRFDIIFWLLAISNSSNKQRFSVVVIFYSLARQMEGFFFFLWLGVIKLVLLMLITLFKDKWLLIKVLFLTTNRVLREFVNIYLHLASLTHLDLERILQKKILRQVGYQHLHDSIIIPCVNNFRTFLTQCAIHNHYLHVSNVYK